MKKQLLILCMLCPLWCFGQIHELFKHRDSLYHQWFGDTAYFSPSNEKLQLQGPKSSSTLYYATQNTLCDSAEWNFNIELGFNPSSTNFVRVYLMSDTNNLKAPLNGYFVQLGQSGGKNKIQLFRQQKTSTTLVFSGTSVFESGSGLSVSLRIKRALNAEWSVFSSVPEKDSITSEGESFTDSTFQKTVAFGFYCKYSTTSRSDMYAFGKVNVRAIQPDEPIIKDSIISQDTIITQDSIIVQDTIITQDSIIIVDSVISEKPIIIEDFDLVVSEIMFDPPANSAEYLELFNRSEHVLHVMNLRLGTFDAQNNLSKSLVITKDSSIVIPPKTYAILSKNPEILSQFHSICLEALFIKMSNFPALPNTSGHFAILRKDSTIIDEISYLPSMHYALLAETKGVSLERLSFEKPGTDANNWHSSSKNYDYATPGCPNSQHSSAIESDELLQLYPSLISPDNDGVDDILSISYHLETSGFTGNIRIFNSAGRMVKHLVKSELLGVQDTYYWDGLSEQNTKLPSGVYIVVFDVFSLDGRMVRVKKAVGYR